MNFKKDLGTIGKYFGTGQFKIVDINVESKDKPKQRLLIWGQWYNIEVLDTDLGISVAEKISAEYIKKQVEPSVLITTDWLSDLIARAFEEGRSYEFSDFNYYQDNAVAAGDEVNGIELWFIEWVAKAFKDVWHSEAIRYTYVDHDYTVEVEVKWEMKTKLKTNTYLIGYKPFDNTILFIRWTSVLARQWTLLD